jgi:hypothetical protein
MKKSAILASRFLKQPHGVTSQNTAIFKGTSKLTRNVARMMENSNAYSLFVRKPAGKWPLGRPRRGWVDNIKGDLREMEWGGMDWIYLAQDRGWWKALVDTAMKPPVPHYG